MIKENNNKKIFVLGPNPAWQVTLFFANLRLGKVNRAKAKKAFSSGKGINFCRAAATTGIKPLLFHFTGGYIGKLINDGLIAEQLNFHAVNIVAESRTCTTCLGDVGTEMTELIEPPGPVTAIECDQLVQLITDNLAECAGIALCGTVPPGAEQLYRRVAEIAKKNQLPLLVDACQNIEDFLNIGKIILKINAEEIKAITGESSITTAIKTAFDRYQLHSVAVTAGAEQAYFYDGTTLFNYQLPKIDHIISSLGAGDTCSAIFFCNLLEQTASHLAFAAGLASATASCLTDSCAEFNHEKAAAIARNIKIKMEKKND
ncbi:MAG: PfkB family carbohydrate kinase [Victivallaceae bacterium]|nr:PfkB family carbohydrate kinase [Victivallaceae bacterium]